MEFINLTPFEALAFGGVDKQGRRYHIVTMSVGYQLKPSGADPQAPTTNTQATSRYEAQLIEQEPLPLVLADEHWGEPQSTSMKAHTDLVDHKPRCDVLVTGHAYSAQARQIFEAQLQLEVGGVTQIDKTLTISGPCQLQRQPGFGSSLLGSFELSRSYRLQPAQAADKVPLRYELAYGGACVVPDERHNQDPQRYPQTHRINEVCYRNPVGTGWVVQGYLQALDASPQGLPDQMRAPQIMLKGQWFEHLVQTQQSGSVDAKQMAQQDYKHTPAGFGPVARAWAPRLALAGTYDDEWLKTRAPDVPRDFDYRFNNCAPQDQQIPWPDLTQGVTLRTSNLKPGGGPMQVTLPGHRAVVLADLGGARLPLAMQVDTMVLDTDAMQLRLVWRTAILQSMQPQSLELRFEVNPQAPLIKYKSMEEGT